MNCRASGMLIGKIIDLMIANNRAMPGMDGFWSQVSQLQRLFDLNKASGLNFDVDQAFFVDNVEENEQLKSFSSPLQQQP
jgi:hypothetical protein